MALLNDEITSATVVGVGTVNTSNVGATQSSDEPRVYGQGDYTIWYAFTPTFAGQYNITSINSSYDVTAAVYRLTDTSQGVNYSNLTLVEQDDDGNGYPNFAFNLDLTANQTYFIGLGSIASFVSPGTLDLSIQPLALPTGSFSVADVSVVEGDTLSQTSYFTITRSGGSAAASVSYTILSGDGFNGAAATAGVDYSAAPSGTVSFAAGQSTASVSFTVIGDTMVEPAETLRIRLSGASGDGTVGRSIGYATIIDNDAPAAPGGTSGDDILIANIAGTTLVGGDGNDTYLVNSSSDSVIEQVGGGTDIVYTTTSYNLGANEVEALSTALQVGTESINLIGNYGTQTIVGNYGNNVLNGGSGGVDTLIGLYGDDTYAVGDSLTVVQEQDGQGFDTLVSTVDYQLAAGVSIELIAAQDRSSTSGLSLSGNEFAQTIAGTAGADTLNGGGGADVLIGGEGADSFALTAALATGNVATLVDFVAGSDRILLSSDVFGAVGTTLDEAEFVSGTAATSADQRIVYDGSTGHVFYDVDGSGSEAAMLFAMVAPGASLSASDFAIMAATATTI